MRLVNAEYGLDILFREDNVEVLILEDKRVMRNLVEELWKQCAGEEGSFVLSEHKILKLDKHIEIIINPFGIDFQSRKIMSALFAKMTAAANEKISEKNRMNYEQINILDNISNSLNYSGITYQLDFAWPDFFKMYGVKIEKPENFLLRLIEYMKVVSELCGISLFCFVNLKSYLNKEEMMDLYKNAEYNKVRILLIESCESEIIDSEHVTIIDKDRCLIER